jgi:hypothetical protein
MSEKKAPVDLKAVLKTAVESQMKAPAWSNRPIAVAGKTIGYLVHMPQYETKRGILPDRVALVDRSFKGRRLDAANFAGKERQVVELINEMTETRSVSKAPDVLEL